MPACTSASTPSQRRTARRVEVDAGRTELAAGDDVLRQAPPDRPQAGRDGVAADVVQRPAAARGLEAVVALEVAGEGEAGRDVADRADLGQPRLRQAHARVPAVPAGLHDAAGRPRRRPSRRPRRRSGRAASRTARACRPRARRASRAGGRRCAARRRPPRRRRRRAPRRTTRRPAPARARRARSTSRAAAACSTAPVGGLHGRRQGRAARCRPAPRKPQRTGVAHARSRRHLTGRPPSAADRVAACMTAMLRRLPCGVTDIGQPDSRASASSRWNGCARRRRRRQRGARAVRREQRQRGGGVGDGEPVLGDQADRRAADDPLLLPVADDARPACRGRRTSACGPRPGRSG